MSSSETAKGKERYRRIFAAALAGMAGKGIALLVSAALVPLAVHSLGAEQYGVLVTITTTTTMLFVLDLGIANTLTNLISEAYARNDRALAAQYFATAFWTVSAIVCVLGAIALAVWPLIPWQAILHLSGTAMVGQVSKAFALAYGLCLLAMPVALTSRVMAGYQEVHLSSAFAAAGSIVSLIAVVTAAFVQAGLPSLVAAFVAGPVVGNAVCLGWICFHHQPWMKPFPRQYRASHLPKIFRSGSLFFLSQLAALVVLNSDNLIIAHYLSPSQVTPYNVTWRLTTYGSSLLSLLTPALWPAYAEAHFRGDGPWIRNTYRRTQRATALSLTFVALVLSVFGKTIIRFWAGASAVPSTVLLLLLCVWMVMFGLTVNQSSLLGATGRVGRQAVGALLAAATNLGLSIWWVQSFGVTGVISGTLVSYLLFIVVSQELAVREILFPSPMSGQRPPFERADATAV